MQFWSTVCREFDCTPLEAFAQPLPMVIEILEARAFGSIYEATRNPVEGEEAPSGFLADLVREFTRADVKRHKDETRKKRAHAE